ncbi:MAG TPA: type II toxin-antitoxin system VapC family toxin [Vicinamibacterales bacterium]|nr:type II toxin-antitoxin system VapC family toxin [Vicinamibacterales bacterium]
MKLLLDTCTFLWALSGEPPLPTRVAVMVQDPDNEVFLSAASSWEIAIKYAAGKLRLPDDPARFVPAMRAERGFTALAVDEEAALHIAKLPMLHGDPFDRLLVAQAIVHGMTILTPDPIVARYPARTMW